MLCLVVSQPPGPPPHMGPSGKNAGAAAMNEGPGPSDLGTVTQHSVSPQPAGGSYHLCPQRKNAEETPFPEEPEPIQPPCSSAEATAWPCLSRLSHR